jgi:hypothetical protein
MRKTGSANKTSLRRTNRLNLVETAKGERHAQVFAREMDDGGVERRK